tara:strand:- start:825 stop:1058 length:234 start_codon:yes stop_codon:yes gene_type:complete
MKTFKMFKFPADVWNNWFERKQKIEHRLKIATGKVREVPMTDVIRFYGKKKMYIWDDEVVNFFMQKKRRKTKNGATI